MLNEYKKLHMPRTLKKIEKGTWSRQIENQRPPVQIQIFDILKLTKMIFLVGGKCPHHDKEKMGQFVMS